MDKDLTKLLEAVGPSGFERDVQNLFIEMMSPYCNSSYFDKAGNAYVKFDGNDDMDHLMFTAHSDAVGYMVKHVDDAGFLFVDDLSGWTTTDYRMLPGTPVWAIDRRTNDRYAGRFVPPVPLHMLSREDMEDSIARCDLMIDLGTCGKTEHTITVGDLVVFEPIAEEQDGVITGTALDDRLGLYEMLQIAKKIGKEGFGHGPITFAATSCEEAITRAAGVLAVREKPDVSITLDATIATDTMVHDDEDQIAKQHGMIKLGDGPVLGRGAGVDDPTFRKLEHCAADMDYQVEMAGEGTENGIIQVGGLGVRTGLVMTPIRYAHTNFEMADCDDIENTVSLCVGFAKRCWQ